MPEKSKAWFPGTEVANLIQKISHLVDRGEYEHNPYDFVEARRLLNNELLIKIDHWVAAERKAAYLLALSTLEGSERRPEGNKNPLLAPEGDR